MRILILPSSPFPSFFFNATASSEIHTLSLHDALPILATGRLQLLVEPSQLVVHPVEVRGEGAQLIPVGDGNVSDRKSTRLNSSHLGISYAVFCLKKKKK